jgi:hypothetical protein
MCSVSCKMHLTHARNDSDQESDFARSCCGTILLSSLSMSLQSSQLWMMVVASQLWSVECTEQSAKRWAALLGGSFLACQCSQLWLKMLHLSKVKWQQRLCDFCCSYIYLYSTAVGLPSVSIRLLNSFLFHSEQPRLVFYFETVTRCDLQHSTWQIFAKLEEVPFVALHRSSFRCVY